jgi:hypothetical protein
MPWFKIDDKAHSHPKWLKAGNAALGLFVRAGSYSAQHLTEGIISAEIAQLYGTAPQAAKLVKVGLWHQAQHNCPRCPQPNTGDYVIHDFFEGGRNSTRQQVEDARKRATDRQSKYREKQNATEKADENASNRSRFGDEKDAKTLRNEPPFQGSTAGQDGLSQRHPAGTVTPLQASPSTSLPPTEVELASYEPTGQLSVIGDRPRIPASCQPLVEALTNARLIVGWDTNTNWLLIEALVKRCGVPMLVDHANTQWQRARKQPQTGNYFLPGWRTLPDAPSADAPTYRPVGPVSRQQEETDSYFDRAMARARVNDEQRKEIS